MHDVQALPLTRRSVPKLLSFVLPVYNEEEVLPLLRTRLESVCKRLPCPVEMVFVNDGSRDGSLPFLLEWAEKDSRVKVLALARNFGHQAAVTAGLDYARGDAIVLIDADLQDPPELVEQMLGKYCEGYDVVVGRRASRAGETWLKRATAFLFYRFMRAMIHRELPADVGDFRLISRKCLDVLRSMREQHRFLRGMTAWMGFPQTVVDYDRDARAAGVTKYPLRRMVALAWNAAVSFSPTPLRLSLLLGIAIAFLGFSWGGYAILRALVVGDTVPGWTTTIIISSMLGGTILISNGILGEYVGRIFEEIKGRPLYVVARAENVAGDTPNVRSTHELTTVRTREGSIR